MKVCSTDYAIVWP